MTRDEVLETLTDQHRAIDALFALLIEATREMHTPKQPFFPSRSGWIWDACVRGNAVIQRLKAGEALEVTENSHGSD